MRLRGIGRAAAAVAGLALATGLAGTARAGITGANVFGNAQYIQTSSAAPSLATGYFFSSQIFYSDPADVSDAQGQSGGNPGFNYGPQGAYALYQTSYISQSTLDGYLTPGGSFQASITAGGLAGTTLSAGPYGPDLSSVVPYLTGGSYGALQSLDASAGAGLTINGFAASPGASDAFTFVTITRTSDNAVVYSQSYLSPGTTSLAILAGTLAADTSYVLEIDYSNRLTSDLTVGGVADPLVGAFTAGYDVRTQVAFTTLSAPAVPEPSSLLLGALGAVGVAGLARRRGLARA